MIIFSCYAFFHRKIQLRPKNTLNPYTFIAAFYNTYILGDDIDILLEEGANVRLSNRILIKTFVSRTLFMGYKSSYSDPLILMIFNGESCVLYDLKS